MPQLSDDLKRLRREMDTLQSNRDAFRRELSGAMGRLRSEVQETQKDARASLENLHRQRSERARQTREESQQFLQRMRDDLKNTLSQASQARNEATRRMHDDHRALLKSLQSGLSELRSQTQGRLRDAGRARADAAREAGATRRQAVAGVVDRVKEVQRAAASLREEMRSAMRAAHEALASGATESQPAPQPSAAASQLSGPSASGVRKDDLTALEGIGRGLQERLYERGIYTYTDLANSRPEDLESILGSLAGDPEALIEQASRFAES